VSAGTAAVLDAIAATLEGHPEIRTLELQGNADPGEAGDLRLLSRKRAEAVKAALTKRGVLGNRLSVKALGASMPATKGRSLQDRSRNRRVELRIAP
jgi:outer membrane protein OmpA-like peptidoglycan-associated protein